jgi:hypothetical protein
MGSNDQTGFRNVAREMLLNAMIGHLRSLDDVELAAACEAAQRFESVRRLGKTKHAIVIVPIAQSRFR